MTQSGHGDEGHDDGHDDDHDDDQELITDIAPPVVIGECHSYPKHGPLSRLSFGGMSNAGEK